MPFSILLQGYPTSDVPVAHVQGPVLQGMFLHLISEVDPAVADRLHHEDNYRPYTLSPLGISDIPPLRGARGVFSAFRLPRYESLRSGTPCYLRITMMVDALFPVLGRYFLERSEPTFRLGDTEFVVTGVLEEHTPVNGPCWTQYLSYAELINKASRTNRKIVLRFLTPTSFRRGDVDFSLPDPRLVFRSYQKRFEEFHHFEFLPDLAEQIELHVGVSNLKHLETGKIKTQKLSLAGFSGRVTYQIDRKASPELIFQMNLLANYAFFCGTGRKTTVGMGQTVRVGS
jgi:CRISPR-associated endoribonuclease Cas6